MPTNGKSTWIRWGIGIFVVLMLTFVSAVIANDQLSRQRDTEITEDMISRDAKVKDCLIEKVEEVEDIVTDIRLEQREQKMLLREIKEKII